MASAGPGWHIGGDHRDHLNLLRSSRDSHLVAVTGQISTVQMVNPNMEFSQKYG
jgi:hypothetical protein